MHETGYLVLESGETYQGSWLGGESRAGEIVFNTSHAGYEEIATDPSYYRQIVLMTAPMQGNYGVAREVWESRRMWIDGFISQEVQRSERDSTWKNQLAASGIPILSDIDTRAITLRLRNGGTPVGALVRASSPEQAKVQAAGLIESFRTVDQDWVHAVSRERVEDNVGALSSGPRIAVLDFGCKENILRELHRRSSALAVFPARTSAAELLRWEPDGILLSNGPGDPTKVVAATETVRALLGKKPIFGICMGHQILGQALGAKTYRLKFGHRGSNHPVRDRLLNQIYVTSQNHGYAVDAQTLPEGVRVTHDNLNDGTIEGIALESKKCFSVQYHPESHPGPHEGSGLFDYFVNGLR